VSFSMVSTSEFFCLIVIKTALYSATFMPISTSFNQISGGAFVVIALTKLIYSLDFDLKALIYSLSKTSPPIPSNSLPRNT
jgi:hypothetical protein